MSGGLAEAGWRRVHLGRIYAGVTAGRLAWFEIVTEGRADRLGLRVVANGRTYEFKLRGGAWVRGWDGEAGGKVGK